MRSKSSHYVVSLIFCHRFFQLLCLVEQLLKRLGKHRYKSNNFLWATLSAKYDTFLCLHCCCSIIKVVFYAYSICTHNMHERRRMIVSAGGKPSAAVSRKILGLNGSAGDNIFIFLPKHILQISAILYSQLQVLEEERYNTQKKLQ